MTRFIRHIATTFAIAIALSLSIAPAARADTALEYRIKAAFLYNFAKFIDWPEAAFSTEDAPVIFCVVGPDPFGDSLRGTVDGRKVGGRDIVIRLDVRPDQTTECHLVFSPNAQAGAVARILQQGVRAGLLTVGEGQGFLESGGIISLVVEDGKVRFDVNTEAAEAADLKVSSQLLKLARTVKR
jgi:hypothetical protein